MNGIRFKHINYDEIYLGYEVEYNGEMIYVVAYGTSTTGINAVTYSKRHFESNFESGVWVKS